MKLIIFILCALSVYAQECVPGYTYDASFSGLNFTCSISGSWTFIRGRQTYFNGWLEGPNEGPCLFYSSGLPSQISITVNNNAFVDGKQSTWSCYGGHSLVLDVPADLPLGESTWTLIVSRNNVVNYTMCSHIRIIDVPKVPRNPVDKSNLTVPALELWEAHMIKYADKYCQISGCCWEGASWYYDGVKVYHQIRDYFGNDSYIPCIESHRDYFEYVLSTKGGFGGWRVFPHGLYLEYIRTGNESYRDGVLFLGNNSALANSGGDASADNNRETAYLIHTYNMMSKLGVDVPKREKAIQNAIGHVDQWFISKQPFLIQSFMVGLTCDAFIEYWEETKDERVPWIVQIALEGLWDVFYNETDRTLNYNTESLTSYYDLNLILAHEFIWLWAYTGNTTYRDRGDILFETGVQNAYLDGGKQFSQNYRNSFKFVKWRQDPDLISGAAGPISPSVSPSGKTVKSSAGKREIRSVLAFSALVLVSCSLVLIS